MKMIMKVTCNRPGKGFRTKYLSRLNFPMSRISRGSSSRAFSIAWAFRCISSRSWDMNYLNSYNGGGSLSRFYL